MLVDIRTCEVGITSLVSMSHCAEIQINVELSWKLWEYFLYTVF